MSQVISLRLRDEQVERLRRVARQMNRTASEAAALVIEEAMRMSEFAFVHFKTSPAGRQAYIQGTGLAVWEVVLVARSYGEDEDAVRTAEHLGCSEAQVLAALNYEAAFPDEIELAIADNQMTFERLSRMLPGMTNFAASESTGRQA